VKEEEEEEEEEERVGREDAGEEVGDSTAGSVSSSNSKTQRPLISPQGFPVVSLKTALATMIHLTSLGNALTLVGMGVARRTWAGVGGV
jgi:hypothetical protein